MSMHGEDLVSQMGQHGLQESSENDSQHPQLDHPDNIDGKPKEMLKLLRTSFLLFRIISIIKSHLYLFVRLPPPPRNKYLIWCYAHESTFVNDQLSLRVLQLIDCTLPTVVVNIYISSTVNPTRVLRKTWIPITPSITSSQLKSVSTAIYYPVCLLAWPKFGKTKRFPT